MPRILDGTLHLFFAFDVGQAVDLGSCRKRLAAELLPASPLSFRFEPEPVRVAAQRPPLPLAGRATEPRAEALIYDFGAVSVSYALRFEGDLADCGVLATDPAGIEAIARDARAWAQALLGRMGDAVTRAGLAPIAEDYLVFAIRSLDVAAESLATEHAAAVARILRSERGPLSTDEVQDALSARIAYGPGEIALIDWNAALVVEGNCEDTLAVLEYANTQLLEVRYLDGQLDRALDRAYDSLAERRTGPRLDYRRVGRFQVDGAVLFERVNNALKLVGDQYLARLYRLAARRFHLVTWNESILRKLETIDSIYAKLFHRASASRMEVLEWLIILLIALGIALPFLI